MQIPNIKQCDFAIIDNFLTLSEHKIYKNIDCLILERHIYLKLILSDKGSIKFDITGFTIKSGSRSQTTIAVNSEILLQKLYHDGVRGIVRCLMKSYLRNRKEIVKINNVHSYRNFVELGVPQGSVLRTTIISCLHKSYF